MASWSDFAAADPSLAAAIRALLEQYGPGMAYLATVRPDGAPAADGATWKTSLIFSELGEDHPGALVAALDEFSSRGINLSRIESRPLRSQLGRYMFFLDIDGKLDQEPVATAIKALRGKAESVRILGSYPLV